MMEIRTYCQESENRVIQLWTECGPAKIMIGSDAVIAYPTTMEL